MEIEQLEQHIVKLEEEIKAAREELARLKLIPKDMSWPKDGDDFFFIGITGSVCKHQFDSGIDSEELLALGNVFRTKEDTEREIKARKVVASLRMQPGRCNFKIGSSNKGIGVNLKLQIVGSYHWSESDASWNSLYFESQDAAMQAIDAVGVDNILEAATWFSMGR